MNTLLGFELDFWDYLTFVVLLLCLVVIVAFLVWLAGLPGRIAIARKHPDAEAVMVMGYMGFIPIVPWVQAFIWAFRPTDVVDIRRFPVAEAKGIGEEIARLSGKPAAAPKEKTPPETDEGKETK